MYNYSYSNNEVGLKITITTGLLFMESLGLWQAKQIKLQLILKQQVYGAKDLKVTVNYFEF